MSNYSFNVMPTVGISRSRFERKSQHKTSWNLGEIVPIFCDEVLPGDTRSLDLAALVRMSTPIAPIMDNIYLDIYAFFVPNRLVWEHWKEFCGENSESAGIPSKEYSVPGLNLSDNGLLETGLLRYLGMPSRIQYAISADEGGDFFVSALQARGYYLIYNEWFRNQNVIAPIPVNISDNEGVIIDFGANDQTLPLCKASKLPDYFTKALPYAQKGDAVKIPMGNFAPVIGGSSLTALGTNGFKIANADFPDGVELGGDAQDNVVLGAGEAFSKTNLGVNVSAIAGTIDQLRYAFQLQKLLFKDACYGSRYWELLASHFSVTSPDASLQRPEYLGGKRMNVNIDQVVSTAGYDSDSSTTVGATGANSVSAFKGSLFTKSFTEHGHIFIMAVARHDQTYGQGINRMFTRRNRFDFYWPVFANLGAQDIKVKEIYLPTKTEGSSTTVDVEEAEKVFGYQEAWAEYRFKPSIVSGVLDPSLSGSLDFWTLANNFSQKPTLGQTFIEQDRAALARALVTGVTGPDFIGDFYFRDIAVRPMPTFSLPGFADHH